MKSKRGGIVARLRRISFEGAGMVALKILLGIVATVMLLYVVGVNVFINTGVGHRVMNSHPEVFRIDFKRAWTLWPGCVHLTNVDLSGDDTQVQFQVTAEEAQITMSPAGISNKDVSGHHLRGRGISIRIRTRVVKLPPPKELAKLPEIKGFPSPLKPPGPDLREIGVRLQDIEGHNIREVWVDGYRATGDLTVSGGLYFKPRVALRVYPVAVVVNSLELHSGEALLIKEGHGTIHATVEQIALAKMSRSDLAAVTGDIDLTAVIANLRFLNEHLPHHLGITVDHGGGELALALKIDRGVLVKGSSLAYNSPELTATLPSMHARTSLFASMRVTSEQKRADFVVELGSVELSKSAGGKPDVSSKLLRFKGHINDLDYSRTPTVDVHGELPKIVAHDLTFLNDKIPWETPLTLTRGAASLGGHFHFNSAQNHASAKLDLECTNVGLKNKGVQLQGGLRLHLILERLDLDSMRMDLAGTFVSLDDVSIHQGSGLTEHWSGRVDFESPFPVPHNKQRLDTMVRVYLKNLHPVVSVIAENLKLPWIAKALSNIADLKLDTHVQLGETTLKVMDLAVHSDKLTVAGQILVTDMQKKEQHKDGFILLKLGILPVGIEIKDSSTKPILVLPERWFHDRQTANSPAAKPPA